MARQWTILNDMNQVKIFVTQFVKIHFNIILPNVSTGLLSLVVRSKTLYAIIVRSMLGPAHRFRLSQLDNIWWSHRLLIPPHSLWRHPVSCHVRP